jgi:hypothetical protein
MEYIHVASLHQHPPEQIPLGALNGMGRDSKQQRRLFLGHGRRWKWARLGFGDRGQYICGWISTTAKSNITASTISARFWKTGSDVPSLPVPSLKIRKWLGLSENRQWRSTSLQVYAWNRQWVDGHISLPVLAKNWQWFGAITVGPSHKLPDFGKSAVMYLNCQFWA